MKRSEFDLTWDNEEKEFCDQYDKRTARKKTARNFEDYLAFLEAFEGSPGTGISEGGVDKQFTLFDSAPDNR